MDDESPQQSMGLRGLIGLGGFLVGSVVICTGLGWLLDAALDTTPALTLVGVALGIVAGAWGGWLQVRRFLA